MNRKTQACRFTLIELLVGVIAGAILMLTAGMMLVYGYRVWVRSQDQMHMQGDAAAALATIAHMLRQASVASTPPDGIPRVEINTASNQITVGRGTALEAAVFARSHDLIYSHPGREVVLVSNQLVLNSFILTPLPSSANPDEVAIEMRLTTADGVETPVATVLAFRN